MAETSATRLEPGTEALDQGSRLGSPAAYGAGGGRSTGPLPRPSIESSSSFRLAAAGMAAINPPTSATTNAAHIPRTITLPLGKAQIYIAIIEDMLSQLDILAAICPDGGKNLTKEARGEIMVLLDEYTQWDTRHKALLTEQQGLKQQRQGNAAAAAIAAADVNEAPTAPASTSNSTALSHHERELQNEIADVQKQRATIVANLARVYRMPVSSVHSLLKVRSDQMKLDALLRQSIRELENGQVTQMSAVVAEETQQKNALANIMAREADSAQLQQDMKNSLVTEQRMHAEEVSERTQIIQQLKDTIEEITILTSCEQKYMKHKMKAHESAVRLQCSAHEQTLLQKRAFLEERIAMEKKVHATIMQFTAKQRAAHEAQIQEWMARYESGTEGMINAIELLKQRRSTDLDKFEEMIVACEVLEKKLQAHKAETQAKNEERRLQQRRERAALKIQAFWRAMMLKHQKVKSAKGKKGKKGAAKTGSAKTGSAKSGSAKSAGTKTGSAKSKATSAK